MKGDPTLGSHGKPGTRNLVLTIMLVAGVPLLFIGCCRNPSANAVQRGIV